MSIRPLAEVIAAVTRVAGMRRRLLPLFDAGTLPRVTLTVLDALLEQDADAGAIARFARANRDAAQALRALGSTTPAVAFEVLAHELAAEADARR